MKENIHNQLFLIQVNSFIDTGSPYYAQFSSLNEKSRVDRTGFEKVFHEKEDDYDKVINLPIDHIYQFINRDNFRNPLDY